MTQATSVPYELDLGSVDHVLTTTRSVRRRLDLDRAVPGEIIAESLSIASQAPTAGNSQICRWVVVTDPALRASLSDIYRRAVGDTFARSASEARQKGDERTARVYETADWFQGVLGQVPVHVIPCVVSRRPLDQLSAPHLCAVLASVMPSAWSFMLALRARGLGSVWTTVHLSLAEEVATLLDLPEDFQQVALLPVAYTIGRDFRPAARMPIEDAITWKGPR